MSHQNFINFYTNYLESPAGEAARKQFDGIKDKQTFAARMSEAGAAAGFQFSTEEVLSVMDASEAKAAKALAEAAGELSDAQLEGVVGGAGSLGSIPTVNIGSASLSYNLGALGSKVSMSTVMCPW